MRSICIGLGQSSQIVDMESGILHLQRAGYILMHDLAQAAPFNSLDYSAKHIGGKRIVPLCTG
ncbi:hypothetical protein D3C75_1137720 [compost metagenome]